VGAFGDRVNEARLAHVKLTVVLVREMDSQEIINGIWVIEREFIVVAQCFDEFIDVRGVSSLKETVVCI
jgi:hypothetical protein